MAIFLSEIWRAGKAARKAWKSVNLPEAVVMNDARPVDAVIAIIGQTGSGKSSFINLAIDQQVASVAHDLNPHTSEIQFFSVSHPRDTTRRIVLLDTPGLNGLLDDDDVIFHRMSKWLGQSYGPDKRLAGIIYLHEITQARLHDNAIRHLQSLCQSCCISSIGNSVLVTTKWSKVPGGEDLKHEQQLVKEHWKPALDSGSRIRRLEQSQSSALDVIDLILYLGDWTGKHSDIIIPVMGSTGAGKSTFINYTIGREVASVGHELGPHTIKLQPISVCHPGDQGRRIVFLDTPGVGTEPLEDLAILKRIGMWLRNFYGGDKKLAGILYLHDISVPCSGQMTDRLRAMLTALRGSYGVGNVIFTTTHWGGLEEDMGRTQEQQLNDLISKSLLIGLDRFGDSASSAWDIVNRIF